MRVKHRDIQRQFLEICAPAGSWESLEAAIKSGAHSVYFGIGQLNMRARSSANFTLRDLRKIAVRCSEAHVNSYLVLNTIIYDEDMKLMRKICDAASEAGVCAVVASDIAAMQYARSIGLSVHISVQANICNMEAVRFFSQFADVMVLARELSLKQIKHIADCIRKEKIRGPSGRPLRIEIFAHGALCVSVSGKCYMSLAVYNASANRGACYQNCRREYIVKDAQTGEELMIDNHFVMSPKDICTVAFLDRILDAGVSILKIEGRGRSADYVSTVTAVYREALDSWIAGAFNREKVPLWMDELAGVFNRGFWQGGYYLGEKLDTWCGVGGSVATKKKVHAGRVEHYYPKASAAAILLEASGIAEGMEILVCGPATGALKIKVSALRIEGKAVKSAEKGILVSMPVPEKVRKNDKVYILADRKFGEPEIT